MTHLDVQNLTNLLPVMFWIHGGGFYEGSSSEFGGVSPLMSHHIILVTVNYRLGVLGKSPPTFFLNVYE